MDDIDKVMRYQAYQYDNLYHHIHKIFIKISAL